jgi:pyruvate/2-oxoglutarate/acetoin dehydrogenase E1 component
MNYRDSLTNAMTALARDPAVCFVGYGVRYGKAMGTLAHVPEAQLIETPCAENLMTGVAIGLALAGRKPVVFVERMDFLLNAADAIVNHLDKLALMSRGLFKPAVIVRVVVGNRKKPLFTGETHCQNFSDAFASMLEMPVCELQTADCIEPIFAEAHAAMERGESTMTVEYKDLCLPPFSPATTRR